MFSSSVLHLKLHQGCHLWSRDQTNYDQYTPVVYDLYLLHYSPPVFSRVRVTRSLVLCICFVGQCSSFCTISFGHCAICSSSMYGFWLLLWNILAIVLSVLLRCTDTDYLFGIFWPLCCLFFFDVRILITPLISFGHCVVCSPSMYG
jgi:hypothetical protein